MRSKRFVAAAVLGIAIAGLAMPPVAAAEAKTILTYSIKDARAFLWQIHYPQSTFMTEFYSPCDPEENEYECDRSRYNQEPGSCAGQALGRKDEAAETPTPGEVTDGVGPDKGDVGEPAEWPKGNPVQVIRGLALGRLGSSPEAGGLASMYYVDNSGRRETQAHVESDAYVSNRNDYEERCAAVDGELSEANNYPLFAAHMLSRADQTPSTYSMASFTTPEAARTAPPIGYPPGKSKESVSVVKLWEANGRVNGVLTSTVRALKLADQVTVDAVRSIISFSSDGTEKGLKAVAKTEALGITAGGAKVAALSHNDVLQLGENSFLGVVSPVVQARDHGRQITIRAPGLFLAAETPLDQLPLPEDPFLREDALPDVDDPLPEVRGTIGDIRDEFCEGAGRDPSQSIAKEGCRLTLGGRMFHEQVVYVAGAILDAAVGRAPAFSLPPLPSLPKLPSLPPLTPPGAFMPPSFTNTTLPVAPQPVALPRFEVREIGGSPWPLLAILTFTALGFLAIMGRWLTRYAWARSLSHVPPFPAVGWAYRAFLKD